MAQRVGRRKAMIDISDKIKTLRIAKASALINVKSETIKEISSGKTPKGDWIEVTQSVASLSAKKTSDLLPFCHNIPVEWVGTEISTGEDWILIEVTVKSIARTGVEMEALFAAAVAALNVYDMLKPIDREITIKEIKLVRKKGGKSDFTERIPEDFTAGVLVVSDSVFKGEKEDKAGKIILKKLKDHGVQKVYYEIVPDDVKKIKDTVLKWCDDEIDLVITTGGTGLSPRDTTPEALEGIMEKDIHGIMEAARVYGLERTPFAMLSRGISGMRGKTLILTLPGSSRGAKESMDAIFPYIMHIFRVLKGFRH